MYIDTIYSDCDEMFPPSVSRNILHFYLWHAHHFFTGFFTGCKDKNLSQNLARESNS